MPDKNNIDEHNEYSQRLNIPCYNMYFKLCRSIELKKVFCSVNESVVPMKLHSTWSRVIHKLFLWSCIALEVGWSTSKCWRVFSPFWRCNCGYQGPFSVQNFAFNMHNYSRFTFLYEYIKEIYEGQSHRKPYFGSLLEKGFLHLAVSLDKNLNITELK
jgi:hypothetical protein